MKSFFQKLGMNVNYYCYNYNKQYTFIMVNQYGEYQGGYNIDKKIKYDEGKEQESYDLIIMYDKLYHIAIYLKTKRGNRLFKNSYNDCNFIDNMGILYSNFFVNHECELGYNANHGIGQVTNYTKYHNEHGLNKYAYHCGYNFKSDNPKFFCTMSLRMKDILRRIPIWLEEYKSNKNKILLQFRDDTEYNFHIPAYLR